MILGLTGLRISRQSNDMTRWKGDHLECNPSGIWANRN